MYLNKKELIELINRDFAENTIFELSREVTRPDDSYNPLIGTEFGSATYAIRNQNPTEEGCWIFKYKTAH